MSPCGWWCLPVAGGASPWLVVAPLVAGGGSSGGWWCLLVAGGASPWLVVPPRGWWWLLWWLVVPPLVAGGASPWLVVPPLVAGGRPHIASRSQAGGQAGVVSGRRGSRGKEVVFGFSFRYGFL